MSYLWPWTLPVANVLHVVVMYIASTISNWRHLERVFANIGQFMHIMFHIMCQPEEYLLVRYWLGGFTSIAHSEVGATAVRFLCSRKLQMCFVVYDRYATNHKHGNSIVSDCRGCKGMFNWTRQRWDDYSTPTTRRGLYI